MRKGKKLKREASAQSIAEHCKKRTRRAKERPFIVERRGEKVREEKRRAEQRGVSKQRRSREKDGQW